MTLAAHAKVNLTLEVHGLRPDGYHDLRSIVLPIALHDDLTFAPADALAVAMPGDVPMAENLAYRAAAEFARATGRTPGVGIAIAKRIPSGAGLGGGSADAAAVLRALNRLWSVGLPTAALCAIGAAVGSDVPALVLAGALLDPASDVYRPASRGAVLMEGRGERVRALAETPLADYPLPDPARLVVRVPDVFVSTPAVYRAFRPEDRGLCANDLQPAACRLHPEIAAALSALSAEGCTDVRMSGSGSAVFGISAKCAAQCPMTNDQRPMTNNP